MVRVAKNGVLSGKTFTAGEKNKATFFRSTAFYPTRDEVDVLSESSRGSRIVLNTSADRHIILETHICEAFFAWHFFTSKKMPPLVRED